MMQVNLKTENEESSYSDYSPVIGESALAALLSNQTVPQYPLEDIYSNSYHWGYRIARAPQSYHHLRVVQSTPEQQLAMALISLYDSLAAEQQDLEPDARDVLYANLWSLYT